MAPRMFPFELKRMKDESAIETIAVCLPTHSSMQVLSQVGLLHNHQTLDFAPWQIPRAEVDSPTVREAVKVMKANRVLPKNWGCPSDEPQLFPMISKGAN